MRFPSTLLPFTFLLLTTVVTASPLIGNALYLRDAAAVPEDLFLDAYLKDDDDVASDPETDFMSALLG